MSNRLQIALATIVLLGLGLWLGPMLIDWNRYKPEAETWLTQKAGRKVTIGGDFHLRFLPQPRITMRSVQVANAPGATAPTLLTIDGLDARIAILPLITGRLVITALRLDEPALSLERLADGRLNLGRVESAPRRRIMHAGFTIVPHDILVDKIEIAQGSFRYHDAVLNWSETFGQIDATALALEEGGPYRTRAGFSWAGQPWTLAADANAAVPGGARPVTIVLEHVAAGFKAQLAGRLSLPKEAAWQLGGALSVQLASPSAFGAGPAAWGNPAQNSAAPLLMLESALIARATDLQIHDAALRWGDFTARGAIDARFDAAPSLAIQAQGGLLNLDAVRPDLVETSRIPYWPIAALQLFQTASAPQPEEAPVRGLGSIWQGSLDLKLDAIVFGQGRIATPTLTAAFAQGTMEIKDLAGFLPGDTELHVQGKRGPRGAFIGEAQLAGERARELFLWAGLPVQSVEEGRLTRIGYKGGVEIAPGSLRLKDFEAGLDGSVAKGMLALSRPADSGTQIEADLSITRMNTDPYRALFAAKTTPLDAVLAFADSVSGPVKLAVETMLADGYEARGVTSDLNFSASGGTTIRSLRVQDILGAELALSGEAKALSGAASLTLAGTAAGADLRPFFARLGIASEEGEAALGPAAFDLKAELKEGTGEITAEGTLAGARAGARLVLEKAEAPLAGRLGKGALSLDALAQGQNLAIAGRLAGYDPPIGKPGPAAESSAPAYNAVPAPDAQLPPGRVYLTLRRNEGDLTLASGAGLPGGRIALSFNRKGEPSSGRYALKLEGNAPDAAALLAALGIAEAKRKPVTGAFAVALGAEGPADAVALAPFEVSLGAMSIEGEGKLDLSAATPVLNGKLRGGDLDLDLLLGLLPSSSKSEDVPGPWSEKLLDLSVLGRYEGTLAVDAESLTIGRLPFAALKLSLALKDGMLNLNDLRASLFKGPVTANLALRGGTALPGIAASVKFIQMDGAALTQALWKESFLTAPVAGSISLTSQGASTAALAAAANGSLQIKSAAGTIAGWNRQNAAASGPFVDLSLDASIAEGIVEVRDGHIALSEGPALITGRAVLAPFTVDLAFAQEGKPGQITLEGALDKPKRKVK